MPNACGPTRPWCHQDTRPFCQEGTNEWDFFGEPRFYLDRSNRFAVAGDPRLTPASVKSGFSCRERIENALTPSDTVNIDLYLRDCAMTQRKLKLKWAP